MQQNIKVVLEERGVEALRELGMIDLADNSLSNAILVHSNPNSVFLVGRSQDNKFTHRKMLCIRLNWSLVRAISMSEFKLIEMLSANKAMHAEGPSAHR